MPGTTYSILKQQASSAFSLYRKNVKNRRFGYSFWHIVSVFSVQCYINIFVGKLFQMFYYKMVDFTTQLQPSCQNGAQKSPKWCKKGRKTLGMQLPCAASSAELHPRVRSECSWAPYWSIWDGFLMKINRFGHHFGWIFDAFLATNLQTTNAACHDDIDHAICGQLPATPLGAPFSQYIWLAMLLKAQI